jgi:lambda family phage portal protein
MDVATEPVLIDHRGRPLARYDAANISRRTAGWHTDRGTGPNREIERDLGKLIDRHRDLARNNPWARRAIGAIVNNWVGTGIRAQWSSARRQKRWTEWFESTRIDADGRLDGYGLQSLIARTVVESGAALVRRRPRRPGPDFAVPLQIQVMEPDYIDRTKNEALPDGGYIVQGVQFDATGQRTGYWVYDQHPGESLLMNRSALSSLKPASDFLHVFRADRPGQVHGVPWGTGAMLSLRMLADYQDAMLERMRLAACYSVFIRDSDPTDMGGGELEILERLEPGAIEILPPGKDISVASPPQPADDESFVTEIKLAVASDYGIPYEIMTGDLSRVNFSSARMGAQEFGRTIESLRWQLTVPQLLNPLIGWYLDAEAVAGYGGRPDLPLWTAPARQIVDPAREIPAIRESVRSGLMSLPQAIRAQGYDPEVLAREHADYLALLDQLGIAFDSDGRHGKNGPGTAEDTDTEDKPDDDN